MIALAREHCSAFEQGASALPVSLRLAFLPLALSRAYLGKMESAPRSVLTSVARLSAVRRHWLLFAARRRAGLLFDVNVNLVQDPRIEPPGWSHDGSREPLESLKAAYVRRNPGGGWQAGSAGGKHRSRRIDPFDRLLSRFRLRRQTQPFAAIGPRAGGYRVPFGDGLVLAAQTLALGFRRFHRRE
jgi:hypothetical protein